MSAGASSQTIRAPGRFVVAPTDLSAGYPYGGTEVGRSRQLVVQSLGLPFVIESELLGAPTDVLEPPNRFLVAFFLRGWDDDAVEQFLAPGAAVGSTTGRAYWQAPGTAAPGSSATSRALVLLFVPDDQDHVPALIVRRGVPYWTPGADMAWQRQDELGIPLTVECLPDDSGRMVTIQRLADMSL